MKTWSCEDIKEQIVEVTNRFKGLDLVDRVPKELCMEICNIVQFSSVQSLSCVQLFATP